ncbi:MAG: hypothetical protein AAFQ43_15600 [Bacteroidota bacterium]
MHPDQKTSETHRYRAADSVTAPNSTLVPDPVATGSLADRRPEQDQTSEAIPALEASTEPGSAPEVDGGRVAEAGHAYVGRTLDDDLKAHPRVDTPGEGRADN